jgi:xanthine dehydrogenase accessory factor
MDCTQSYSFATLADMTQSLARWLHNAIVSGSAVIAVRIANVLGSTPRDADAVMLVTNETTCGTIGGGALEWTAIEEAREMIALAVPTKKRSLPLGPFLGQCCGGHVTLEFFRADALFVQLLKAREDEQRASYPKLMILGAGHVGRAIAQAMKPLPFSTRVLDTRPEEVALLPDGVVGEVTRDPVLSITAADPGTSFLVLTHSHTMDFLAVEAALKRGDSPYVGMIGSATKRAKLRNWLKSGRSDEARFNRLVCPIGGAGVRDKRPEVIAALVAAELVTAVHIHLIQSQELNVQQQLISDRRKRSECQRL